MIKFTTKDNHRIDLDGTSWVEIRSKMNLKIQASVQADILSVSMADTAGGNVNIHTSDLMQKLAVLKHNIVSWGGPAFVDDTSKPVKFTRAALENLDPDVSLDFINTVYEAINERNQPAGGADPLAVETTSVA